MLQGSTLDILKVQKIALAMRKVDIISVPAISRKDITFEQIPFS